MKKGCFLLLLPFIFLAIAFLKKDKPQEITTKKQNQTTAAIQLKSKDYNSTEFFENYVVEVIEKGSNIFNLPTSPMDGGYVSKEEAKKIACYMATLQGLKPSHPEWVQEGAALFHGNCTGCHGVGGKGKEGYFPDLTRKPLKGIEILTKKESIE